LVQETFLKLWKMRDEILDDDAAVSGLVFTIARNLRKNETRDLRREVLTDEIPEDPDAASMPPATSPSGVRWSAPDMSEVSPIPAFSCLKRVPRPLSPWISP
jgi:DNA-directed RNA polymerase specialized sigma24 family protein